MAIAFDAQSAGVANPGTSITFSHTVGAGSNMILIVGAASNSGDNISTISYAGTNMTQLSKQATVTSGFTYLYYMLAPPAGANNIVVSTGGANVVLLSSSASYSGVKQSVPEVSNTFTAASGATFTESLTSLSDNAWHVTWIRNFGGNIAAGTATTIRLAPVGHAEVNLADTNTAITPAGSNTLTVTGPSAEWRSNGCIIAPALASISKLALLGVG